VRLPDQSFQNARMAVPLVHCRIRGQAVEIALAVGVIYPNALSTLDDYVERVVVMGSELLFQFDQFLGGSSFHHWHAVLSWEIWL